MYHAKCKWHSYSSLPVIVSDEGNGDAAYHFEGVCVPLVAVPNSSFTSFAADCTISRSLFFTLYSPVTFQMMLIHSFDWLCWLPVSKQMIQ